MWTLVFVQEPLLALRESIVHALEVKEEGDNLVLLSPGGGVVSYPKLTKTAFRASGGSHYTLIALWLQWLHKDKSMNELMADHDRRGLGKSTAVLVSVKKQLLSYLTGAFDGGTHIDRDMVAAAPVSGAAATGATAGSAGVAVTAAGADSAAVGGASASAAVPATGAVAAFVTPVSTAGAAYLGSSLMDAFRQERSLRSRRTILDAPEDVDLREIVFKCFAGSGPSAGAGKAASGAVGAPGSKKRERDGSNSGAEPAKKPTCTVWTVMRGPWLALFRTITRGSWSRPCTWLSCCTCRCVDGPPIIVVPNAPTSMVTLDNIQSLLQDGRCVSAGHS